MCFMSCVLVPSSWSAAESWQLINLIDHGLVYAGYQQVPQQVHRHEHR